VRVRRSRNEGSGSYKFHTPTNPKGWCAKLWGGELSHLRTGNLEHLPRIFEELALIHPFKESNIVTDYLLTATCLIHPNSNFEEVSTPSLAEHAISA
jgi:hypothetical protein